MLFAVLAAAVVVCGSAAVAIGVHVLRRCKQPPHDEVDIEDLIAEKGVRPDGKQRRFVGYDPEIQKRAVRRKIARLQESLGESPKATAVPEQLRRVR